MTFRRSLFVQLFFALLLAFAQQQAVLHELDHDFERIHAAAKDVTGHDDAFCAKCLAVAHLGHASGVASLVPIVSTYSPPRVALDVHVGPLPTFVGHYRSRAPPYFS